MPEVKAYFDGAWRPDFGPPGVITRSTTNSVFNRGVAAAWVDDDTGNWTKLVELKPAAAALTAVNNNGRIDLSWDISSSSNVAKFEIYFSTNGVNFSKWATEPAQNDRAAIFGRVSPPVTYSFFIRSVAFNGLSSDSDVTTVSVGGVTAWRSFSHSRAASGWHNRSFTFTAGVQSSSSTITNLTTNLYWRQSTSQGWSLAASYSDNNVTQVSKTFSFSSYTYGQRMFRVEMTATDNQTLQNNGTTGSGYTFFNAWDTTELTAADITGGIPTFSGVALGKTNPGGSSPTNDRQLSFTVGFDAWVDRSEYDSGTITLYRTYDNAYISQQGVDVGALKTNQSIRQALTYTFGGLDAGTGYYANLAIVDNEGVTRTARNDQTTFAVQTSTYTYYTGTTTTGYADTYNGSYFSGLNGEIIGDAPYAAQYNTSKDSLIDGNNNTWYITVSTGSTQSNTIYQRLRAYQFQDYSINYSTQPGLNGALGYYLNWIEFQTGLTHGIWGQVYDRKPGVRWLGSGADPSAGDPFVARNTGVNGNWRMGVDTWMNVTNDYPNEWYCNFDVRAVLNQTRVYGGLSGYRLALAEIRVRTTWYERYDNYATGTYTW